jgi:hypothetical protein
MRPFLENMHPILALPWIEVNDLMQRGYRYEISARSGRDFHGGRRKPCRVTRSSCAAIASRRTGDAVRGSDKQLLHVLRQLLVVKVPQNKRRGRGLRRWGTAARADQTERMPFPDSGKARTAKSHFWRAEAIGELCPSADSGRASWGPRTTKPLRKLGLAQGLLRCWLVSHSARNRKWELSTFQCAGGRR